MGAPGGTRCVDKTKKVIRREKEVGGSTDGKWRAGTKNGLKASLDYPEEEDEENTMKASGVAGGGGRRNRVRTSWSLLKDRTKEDR